MRSKSEKRRGAIAVLVAISLIALIGVAAIALDGGLLLDNHRRVQSAADASALAAACDLFNNYASNDGLDPSGTARASALSTAMANGYNNDGVTSVVTVNIPPQSGNFVGKAGYAEVIIQYNQTRGFSSIFGSGDLPVVARAVARGIPGNIGILVLDPSISDSAELDGPNMSVLNQGQIFVNTSSSTGTWLNKGANITLGGMNLVGGLDNLGGTATYTGSGLQLNTDIVQDPLMNIPEPTDPNITVPSGGGQVGFSGSTLYGVNPTVSIAGMTNYGSVTITSDTTLQPGIYTGITIGSSSGGGKPGPGSSSYPSDPSVSSSGPTVTLMPGLYYLESPSSGAGPGPGPGGGGGLNLLSGTLNGSGVMFVVATGKDNFFNNNANGVVNITPPTPTSGGTWPSGTSSATYNGISVWIPRGDFSEYHVIGGYNMNMPGTWYAQGGEFDIRPSGSATYQIGNYICDQAEWGQGYNGSFGMSSGTFIMNPNTAAPNLRPTLVE